MEAWKTRLEMRKIATLLSSFQQNRSPTIHQVRATDTTVVEQIYLKIEYKSPP